MIKDRTIAVVIQLLLLFPISYANSSNGDNMNGMVQNGMGHVVIKQNIPFKSQVKNTNTIYEIIGDFDLCSSTVEIPNGCILDFNGGSVRNGIIVGNNTVVKADLVKIFGENLSLGGTWMIEEAYPQWFGALGNGINDDTKAIQKTINTFSNISFVKGTYIFSSQIEIVGDRTITGVEEMQNNGNVILKTNSNITCLKLIGNGITINNLTLEHPETNTVPVVDFTGHRYIHLRNIICHHYGKQCPAVGLFSGSVSWTGYDIFENCYFSQYSENVRIENGSFVSFYNCKLNNATKRHLYLGGSVFSFIGCDITKDPKDNVLGVEYTGPYIVAFEGCYLEGFKLTDFAKCTNENIGAGIKISGSKYYLPYASGALTTATAYTEYDGGSFYSPNMLPRFSNGFHNTVNSIINGDFSSGLVRWEKTSNVNGTSISTNVKLPKGQTNGKCFVRNGGYPGEIWQEVGQLSQGPHTIGMWVKADEINSNFRMDIIVSDGRAGTAYKILNFVTKNPKYSDWQYVNCIFDIPEDKVNVKWYTRIYFAGCKDINVTGITLYDGVYTEARAGNSVSEKTVLTNELIIKGEDGKYYKVSVNTEGKLISTEVKTN